AEGDIAFAVQGAVMPAAWSQTACDVLARKYFRRSRVPSATRPAADDDAPEWLRRRIPAEGAIEGPETDARAAFGRLAGAWTWWGWRLGYFDTEADARAFHDDICAMLARQVAAPNSPQWFNTGLHWAYGIEGAPQGHVAIDPESGQSWETRGAYERP